MKKTLTIMAAMMAIAVSATAMPFETAREEALFLSDKMAYELDLTESQYEAVYEINLDYLLNVNCEADVLGTSWIIRNRDLSHVLSDQQYDNYLRSGWFYRPVTWRANNWVLSIYSRYNRGRLFKHRPAVFISFRGGHNHRDASFYARHRFERPAPPRIHEIRVKERHFNGNRPQIVISDRHPSADKEFRRNIGHDKDSHHRQFGRGHW